MGHGAGWHSNVAGQVSRTTLQKSETSVQAAVNEGVLEQVLHENCTGSSNFILVAYVKLILMWILSTVTDFYFVLFFLVLGTREVRLYTVRKSQHDIYSSPGLGETCLSTLKKSNRSLDAEF